MSGSIEAGLRLFIALIFLASSASKVADFRAFASGLGSYKLFRVRLVGPIAILVVVAELVATIALIVSSTVAWPVAAGLLAAFAAVQWRALRRGDRINCHCFNATEEIDAGSLTRTIWLFALALVGFLLSSARGPSQFDDFLAALVVTLVSATATVWLKGLVEIKRARQESGAS